jgi:hypothetical protein
LPEDIHSVKAFRKALSIAEDDLLGSSVWNERTMDSPLLLLGLLFREVSRSIEAEPGEPSRCPQHLVESPLGIGDMRRIEKLVDSIVLPSEN